MLMAVSGRNTIYSTKRSRRRDDNGSDAALAAAEWLIDELRYRWVQALETDPKNRTRGDKTWIRECSEDLLDELETALAEQIQADLASGHGRDSEGWTIIKCRYGAPEVLRHVIRNANLGMLFHGWDMPLTNLTVWVRPGRVDVRGGELAPRVRPAKSRGRP